MERYGGTSALGSPAPSINRTALEAITDRQTHVQETLEMLHANRMRLESLTKHLAEKLSPVLRPMEGKDGDNRPGAPAPLRVPLATVIAEESFQINDSLNFIESIISRIEL